MQANQLMIAVNDDEMDALKQPLVKKSLPDIIKRGEDSSAFETEDQIEFMNSLGSKDSTQPSDLEVELIAGLFHNKALVDKSLLDQPKKKKRIRRRKQHQV